MVAATFAFDQPLALAMIVPASLSAAFWTASLMRQVAYEITQHGHITNWMDACAFAFLPFTYLFSLAFIAFVGVVIRLVDAASRGYSPPTLLDRKRYGYAIRIATAFASAGGIVAGLAAWSDWQLQQTCL